MDDTNNNEEKVGGIWIAAEIAQHPDLTMADKFCFGIISALDKGQGFWMKNETLAKLVGISPTYASVCIKRLSELGFVTIDQVAGGRRTVICVDRAALRLLAKTTRQGCENHKAPLAKTTRPTHNTRDDNTSGLKTEGRASDKTSSWTFDFSGCKWQDTGKFTKVWLEWVEYRKQMKASISQVGAVKQFNFLTANASTEDEAVLIIETSIRNGWKGLFPYRAATSVATNSFKANHPSTKIDYTNDGLS